MPSRADTSFLHGYIRTGLLGKHTVSMPSRADTSFLLEYRVGSKLLTRNYVSMPSRADTSFLPLFRIMSAIRTQECQCPLGLIPHFYQVHH